MPYPLLAPSHPTTITSARMWDACNGGRDNRAVDRRAIHQLTTIHPGIPDLMHQHRREVPRIIAGMVLSGIRDIIDLGCGLPGPSFTDTHHLAPLYSNHETVRVVYIDHDPVVIGYRNALSSIPGTTTMIASDIRDLNGLILRTPELEEITAERRPVGILAHHVLGEMNINDAQHVITGIMAPMAPGSTISIALPSLPDPRPTARILADYEFDRIHWHTRTDIDTLTAPLRTVKPTRTLWAPNDPTIGFTYALAANP